MTSSYVIDMIDISDHSMVVAELKISYSKEEPRFITYRDFSKLNYDLFKRDMLAIDWNCLKYMSDVNDMLMFWNVQLLELFNIYAPLKTIRITKQAAPWLTDNLKLMIKLKKKAYQKFKTKKTDNSYIEYKNLRNFVNASIKSEKRHILLTSSRQIVATFGKH